MVKLTQSKSKNLDLKFCVTKNMIMIYNSCRVRERWWGLWSHSNSMPCASVQAHVKTQRRQKTLWLTTSFLLIDTCASQKIAAQQIFIESQKETLKAILFKRTHISPTRDCFKISREIKYMLKNCLVSGSAPKVEICEK